MGILFVLIVLLYCIALVLKQNKVCLKSQSKTAIRFYSFDLGNFFRVAAKTAVNFIARFIFPLIFNIPFMNACCGCISLLIIFPITSSVHNTCKSAFPSKISPSATLQSVGEERSRLYTLSPLIVNTTLPLNFLCSDLPPLPATASDIAAKTSEVELMIISFYYMI